MAIIDATIETTVKKKPFIWLYNVQPVTFNGLNPSRLYTAGAAEKLLMAKIWMETITPTRTIQFFKGDNAPTTAISHALSTNNIPGITNPEDAFDPTQSHLKYLIGAAASEDLILTVIGTTPDLNAPMHIQLYFEE